MAAGKNRAATRVVRYAVVLAGILLAGSWAGRAAAASGNTIYPVAGQQFSGQVAAVQTGCRQPLSPSGTINWGDGTSSAAQITVSGSNLQISGSHTYTSAGTYSGNISGSYQCGIAASLFSATFTAQVSGPPVPRAVLSPGSLTFNVEVNEFNQNTIDSDPQTVTISNHGSAPLTIARVRIAGSAGGFVIDNACVPTLVNDSYTTDCSPPSGPADTCTGATLAVGQSCSVAVEYREAGLYSPASGSLEVDSNSPTSPDLAALSGTSKFISAISQGAVPGGCPGVIADTDAPYSGGGAEIENGSGIHLAGCWTDTGIWGAVGPVTINGDVTLTPTNPGDELFVSPSFAGGTANDTIFATPSNARYVVQVAPPAASGSSSPQAAVRRPRLSAPASALDSSHPVSLRCAACELGTSWALEGPNTLPLGVVNLGKDFFVCSHAWEDALADYVGCSRPLTFQANQPADVIHGLPIAGGSIFFGACGAETVSAYAALPHLFSSTSVAGSAPPTATFEFGGCSQPPDSTGSGGASAPPLTCPGAAGCPSQGTIIPAQPHSARGGGRSALSRQLIDRAAHGAGDATGSSCPAGDVDYTANTPESFVGAMDFGTPYLCYDPARDVWTAGGSVNVLDASVDTGPPPDFGIGFRSNGSFDHGGIESVDFGSPGLMLAPAVGLSSFGGSFGVDPTRLQASATVTVGDVLHIDGGAFAVWANPSHPYTYQPYAIPGVADLVTNTHQDPLTGFAAGVGGNVSLSIPVLGTVQLASGYVFYAAPSYFEFQGCLGGCSSGLSLLGVATLYAQASGQLDTGNGEYNVAGSARVCANFPVVGNACPASLNLDVSNQGLGACASFLGITGGVIVNYGQGVSIQGPFSCDLTPITVVVQRSRAVDAGVAHIAQTSGAVSLNLPGHPPSTSIYVSGVGGAPTLALAGPHGERLTQTTPGQGVHTSDLVIWPEPKLDETLVAIRHPAAGRWTLTPLAGSAAISRVAYANGLPPAKVTASVSGRGHTRTLAYRIRPREGQRVTFAERSGRVFHVLGVARATRGRLRFSASLGPGGRRQIVALVSDSGVPDRPIVVTSYSAPPPPVAGKPARLRLGRHADALTLTWAKAANAQSYLAVVSLSDGLRAAYPLPRRQRRVAVPGVGPDVGGRIQVFALSSTGVPGRAASAMLSPVGAPAKLRQLKVKRVHGRVLVTWRRSRGAVRYLLSVRVNRPGAPLYAPVVMRKNQFVSTRTLPGLPVGTAATITVIALGPTGAESAPSSVRYRTG